MLPRKAFPWFTPQARGEAILSRPSRCFESLRRYVGRRLSEVAPKDFLTRAMAEKEATKPRPKKEFATRRH